MTPAAGNYKIMDPSEFSTHIKKLEETDNAEFIVPIPKRYGGNQEESEEATLEEADADKGGFTIAKTKEEAQKQMEVLETEEQKAQKNKPIDLSGLEGPKKSPGLAALEGFGGEDYELIHKKEVMEAAKMTELNKKAEEEAKKKEERLEKGQKEFATWMEYFWKIIDNK